MAMTYNRLIGTELDLAVSGTATVDDVWFDLETGRIPFLRIRSGGWLNSENILIPTDRLDPPDQDANIRAVHITDEDLASAPRWPDNSGGVFADWPPIIVGPFGSTISGPLLGAQMKEALGQEWPVSANTSAPRLTEPLEQASTTLGSAVFARDGEIGPVSDLLLEPGTWRVEALMVENPERKDPVHVPFSALRHRGQKSGHLVVSGSGDSYGYRNGQHT